MVAVQTSEVLAEDSGWLRQKQSFQKAHTIETSEVFSTLLPDHLNVHA